MLLQSPKNSHRAYTHKYLTVQCVDYVRHVGRLLHAYIVVIARYYYIYLDVGIPNVKFRWLEIVAPSVSNLFGPTRPCLPPKVPK